MRAIHYTNKFSIISYISFAISFIGYPLAFYLYHKFKMPFYMNAGVILVVLPVVMLMPLIPSCSVNAYIDDCVIIIERYMLKAIWPSRARLQYLFSEVQKIEFIRSDDKCFLNIYLSNKQYLSMPDMPLSYLNNIHKCYGKEIIELSTPGAKEKRTIALFFGAIVLDIILIFVAIYLAT